MSYRACFHGCRGACIAHGRQGCAASCHRGRDWIPPEPESPVGRYLALVRQAEDRVRGVA